MKTQLSKLLVALGLGLLSGCATHHESVVVTPGGEVVTSARPPAEGHEAPGAPPASSYRWVPGYWTYHDRWVWIPGHWDHPPRTGSHWVPGHWDYTERGWVWTPGRWDVVG